MLHLEWNGNVYKLTVGEYDAEMCIRDSYKGLDFQYLYADGITGYELKFTTFQVGIGIYSVQIIVCVAFAAVLLLSHIRYKKLQKGGA